MKYVLWDWNGTLLDDTKAAVAALNGMLARRGLDPIGLPFYREHFAFPVRPFYERIGFVLANEDWDALAREYHAAYAAEPKALNVQALEAVRSLQSAGIGQSVISALRQDLLDQATVETGVAPYMDRICGTDNLDGASKLDRARELMRDLMCRPKAVRAEEVVLIGDALHDKEVADALGVRCVLCGQGSHAQHRLAAVAPTGDDLFGAVALALRT